MKSSPEKPNGRLPYEENKEGFGKWFREQARDKWESYLNGDSEGESLEERDAMRAFLLEYGTEKEIKTKLDSYLNSNISAYQALREEVKLKRSDIRLD